MWLHILHSVCVLWVTAACWSVLFAATVSHLEPNLYRIIQILESPEKSWNQALILEIHGNVNSWCDKLIDDRQTVENSGNIRYLTDICNTALQHLLQQVC